MKRRELIGDVPADASRRLQAAVLAAPEIHDVSAHDTIDVPKVVSPWLDQEEAALYLRLSDKPARGAAVLQKWFWQGKGPKSVKHGRKRVYRREWLDEWSDAQFRQQLQFHAPPKRRA